MKRPTPHRHLQWPAQRFYWAVLDTSVLPPRARWARQPSAQQLGYLFESVIPGLPIEEVHAIYRRVKGHSGRYIACGVQESTLQNVDGDTLTLTPREMPAFIGDVLDPASLNLLTGPHLPRPLRRLQRRWLTHVALVLVVCAGVLLLGTERRVRAVHRQLDDAIAARTSVLEQVLGPPTSPAASTQPPQLRLTAELRRLEQTRNADVSVTKLTDASAVLQDVVARWPADVHTRTEAVSVTSNAIMIRATVATMADAQRLADSFVGLDHWRLRQPQSESTRGRVDVTLRLERQEQEEAS